MTAMNKVASHINEMQKLHEEYGAVFDLLISEQTADKKEVEDSNPSLSHMNPLGILWTPRHVFTFVFAIPVRWLICPWGIFCCIALSCGSTHPALCSKAKRSQS